MNSYTKEIVHMNDNERKDVHELTAEELIIEIAQAIGWRIEQEDRRVFIVAPWSSRWQVASEIPISEAWSIATQWPPISQEMMWTYRIGAAYELALEVGMRADCWLWSGKVNDGTGEMFDCRFYSNDGGVIKYSIFGMRTVSQAARALSELAALALRQMGE